MKRKLLLVVLLLTGFALADQTPQQAGGVAQAQGQTGTPAGQSEAQAKPKAPQKRSAEAQAQTTQGQAKKPEAASGKAAVAQSDKNEEPQAQTEDAPAQTDKDGKLTSVPGGKGLGMSVLGNQEAPKALVIVPWKSSDVGRAMGVSPMLDDSRLPVDKEVFMRELRYYEIKSQTKP
jgi:hypothetical protein